MPTGHAPGSPELTSALRATLREVEAASKPQELSPLAEADPNSLQILFDRVNQKLIEGLPEAIEERDLDAIVDVFLAKRHLFLQEEQAKAQKEPRKRGAGPAKAKPLMAVGELDELEDLA